jgi:pimeloyl-ACP methyl ester carboxylesterase
MVGSGELRTRTVQANDLQFALLEAGSGPLALCLHGFPDSARTWQRLLPELAAAGFHAAARLSLTLCRCTRSSAATAMPF